MAREKMKQNLTKPVARVNDVFNISEAGKFLGNQYIHAKLISYVYFLYMRTT